MHHIPEEGLSKNVMLTSEGITSFEKLFVIFVFLPDTCWVPTHPPGVMRNLKTTWI
jgi:hypothetical protein